MPGEAEGEVVAVSFPDPEVPGWGRYATAAGVIHDRVPHDQDLPRGTAKAPYRALVLRNAPPPLQIPAAIASL